MAELTQRQRAVLDFIMRSVDANGYPPSVREIGEAVGLASPSTVHAHVQTLTRRGYLRKDAGLPRAMEVRHGPDGDLYARPSGRNLPVLGQIAAGMPLLAAENLEGTIAVPDELVPSQSAFVLRIRGDSMTGAGIHNGDYVIVRQQDSADEGDIVAACVTDTGEPEATVKTFRRAGGRIVLVPENDGYEPIIPSDVRILGKVCGLIRKI